MLPSSILPSPHGLKQSILRLWMILLLLLRGASSLSKPTSFTKLHSTGAPLCAYLVVCHGTASSINVVFAMAGYDFQELYLIVKER